MGKQIIYVLCIIACIIVSIHLCAAQSSHKMGPSPATLDEYDFVARGKMSGDREARPEQIARMDNNGEILLACLEAKTGGQLQSSGLKFLQSQLELLVDWNLLEYDSINKTYNTTVHVYGIDEATAIRRKVNEAVNELAMELNTDVQSLKNHLSQMGREKALFAIFYAYILHGYAMQQFGDEIYQQPQLSGEYPFWKGYAWAIYPKKKFGAGVFSMPVEGDQFFIVSAAGSPRLDFKQFMAFVKDAAVDHKVDDPELRKSLSGFDLFDDEGNLTVPTFEKDWSMKLENIAKNVFSKTTELANDKGMKVILGMETLAQAEMFLHYEIRHAFLIHLLERGTIPVPFDFENEANNLVHVVPL